MTSYCQCLPSYDLAKREVETLLLPHGYSPTLDQSSKSYLPLLCKDYWLVSTGFMGSWKIWWLISRPEIMEIWIYFPCKVQGSTRVTSLGVEFQLFSDHCSVGQEGLNFKSWKLEIYHKKEMTLLILFIDDHVLHTSFLVALYASVVIVKRHSQLTACPFW